MRVEERVEHFITLALLVVATTLEASGDAIVRMGR
jgi:hypothetical protein